MAIQQAKQVHTLCLVIGTGGEVPIVPLSLPLQPPAEGGGRPTLRSGDARLVLHRVNGLRAERAAPEGDVCRDRRSVRLYSLGIQHAGEPKDQPQRKDTHGGGEHHQEGTDLIVRQIAPDLAPDDAHSALKKRTSS